MVYSNDSVPYIRSGNLNGNWMWVLLNSGEETELRNLKDCPIFLLIHLFGCCREAVVYRAFKLELGLN